MRLPVLILFGLLAGPAAAQFAPRAPRSPVPGAPSSGWGRDLGQVYDRIDDGRDSGRLSKRDTRLLRREARQIGTLGERYEQGGLSDAEARELETRNAVLRTEVDARRLGSKPERRRP